MRCALILIDCASIELAAPKNRYPQVTVAPSYSLISTTFVTPRNRGSVVRWATR